MLRRGEETQSSRGRGLGWRQGLGGGGVQRRRGGVKLSGKAGRRRGEQMRGGSGERREVQRTRMAIFGS